MHCSIGLIARQVFSESTPKSCIFVQTREIRHFRKPVEALNFAPTCPSTFVPCFGTAGISSETAALIWADSGAKAP